MSPAQSRTLLTAVSDELLALRESVESVSALVAVHVSRCQGEARIRALVDAQAIDGLSQRLEVLSGVTGAMARGEDLETVLADVGLADLSERLRCGDVTVHRAPGSVAGDLMLFE